MIIKLLKSQKPYSIGFIPVIILIFWFNIFYNFQSVEFQNTEYSMPLFNFIANYLSSYKIFSLFVILVLLILQAVYINRMNSRLILIEGRSNALLTVFLLFTSCINFSMTIHPIYIASIFIVFAINFLLKTYKNSSAVSSILLSGIFIGIGSLFCLELIFLLVPFWFGLSFLRSFNLREWLILNIGLIVPHIFSFAYFFLFENDLFYADRLIHSIKVPTTLIIEINWQFYVLLSTILLLSLSVVVHYIKENHGYKISSIKYFNVLLLFLLAGFVMVIIFQNLSFMIFTAMPLTFLTSNYILAKKHTLFKDVFLITLILALISINIPI